MNRIGLLPKLWFSNDACAVASIIYRAAAETAAAVVATTVKVVVAADAVTLDEVSAVDFNESVDYPVNFWG